MDLIEREIKNGQHDSDFMKSQGLSSEIIAEQAELIKEASDEIAEEITIEEKKSSASDTKNINCDFCDGLRVVVKVTEYKSLKSK
jgi:hypothetical protein